MIEENLTDKVKEGHVMKKFILVALSVAAIAANSAYAQSGGPLLFGGKVGFSKPHGSNNDSGVNVFGVLGQRIENNVYWEAELGLNLIDGDIDRGRANNDWSINSIAGYGVFRTNGSTHLKAKIGVSYWDDDFDDDINLSAGVGIGIRAGSGVIDVEYTQINPYADYITVGYMLRF